MAFSATFSYEIVDRYTAKIKAMQKVTSSFKTSLMGIGAGADKFGNKLGKMSSKLANLRTGFAVTMMTMGLKGAIKASLDFETIMHKVEAVVQTTTAQTILLRKEAKKQGLETRFSAVQAAQGMEMLGLMGYKTAQILELIPQVLTLATAGDLEMAESSQILTGTLKTFSMGMGQAERIVDRYAVTSANSATNMTDLNAAMRNFGPLGAAAGMQFEDMVALVGALADKNIKGAAAGTLLMNAIRNLIKPSNEAIETLKRLGFKKDEVSNASGQIEDFIGFLELLEKRGAGVADIFSIFQVRGAKAVAALRGQVPVIRELVKKYGEQAGAGKIMADIMEKDVTGSSHKAISAWEGLRVAVGKGLEPWTMAVQDRLTKTFKYIADRPALSKNLGITLVILTAVLVVLTLIGVVLGTMAAGVIVFGAAFSGVFVAVAGSIALLGAAVVKITSQWEDFKAGFTVLSPAFERLRLMTEQEEYKKRHKDVLDVVGENLKKGLSPMGQPRRLSPSMSGPESTTTKVQVETVVTGSIDVNDRTGGKVTTSPTGGDVPINVRKRRGGGAGGSW